jgi:Flp pilus assembly protein TadB
MHYISFKTASARPSGPLGTLVRLALLIAVGLAMLALFIIGFFVIVPVMLIGGLVSYFYLRRRLRKAQQSTPDGVIDAEYTVIER